jgi:hypothetical protein
MSLDGHDHRSMTGSRLQLRPAPSPSGIIPHRVRLHRTENDGASPVSLSAVRSFGNRMRRLFPNGTTSATCRLPDCSTRNCSWGRCLMQHRARWRAIVLHLKLRFDEQIGIHDPASSPPGAGEILQGCRIKARLRRRIVDQPHAKPVPTPCAAAAPMLDETIILL